LEKRQNAANLCVFSHLQQASQASDVGSIPIARSINPIDSNTFTGLKPPKTAYRRRDFGRSWTRDCCKMVQLDAATG